MADVFISFNIYINYHGDITDAQIAQYNQLKAIASYKIPLVSDNRSFVLQPLLGYRIVKGYNNIIDGGVNFSMNNYGIYMQAIYHSSQSLGLCFGLDQNAYALNFGYNLETGPIRVYTQGAFELGLKLRLFKRK